MHTYDASKKTYITVVYLRIETNDGEENVAFISGKSHVSLLTIAPPKLDLEVVVMESKLA